MAAAEKGTNTNGRGTQFAHEEHPFLLSIAFVLFHFIVV
jgi:hypothetical protein